MLKCTLKVGLAAMVMAGSQCLAAVSADEAAKLKTTLTPLGAERAGNKEGTIPAWVGAYAEPIAGAGNGKYPDPFASEKPLFQITAKNVAEYQGKLSEGTVALLKKFPDYRIDVYPTHRTGGAPQWVYDNTFKVATQATLSNGGLTLEGAWAAVPFPIPKTGQEAMWNTLLHPVVASYDSVSRNFVGTADGKRTMASKVDMNQLLGYWVKDGSPEKYNRKYEFIRFETKAPAFKAGEAVTIHEGVDHTQEPSAWQYLVGQRRVRRTPTIGYDTPDFVASGANYFDEVFGFSGHMDRFDWKLIGKQEMIIPANNNRFFIGGEEKALVPFHTNPDAMRWELHRVWVVEASVAPGKRHVVPKRRFYLDEDTWCVVQMDGYDAQGKLWRTSQVIDMLIPEASSRVTNTTIIYNLLANTMSVVQFLDSVKPIAPRTVSFFSADALTNESSR